MSLVDLYSSITWEIDIFGGCIFFKYRVAFTMYWLLTAMTTHEPSLLNLFHCLALRTTGWTFSPSHKIRICHDCVATNVTPVRRDIPLWNPVFRQMTFTIKHVGLCVCEFGAVRQRLRMNCCFELFSYFDLSLFTMRSILVAIFVDLSRSRYVL